MIQMWPLLPPVSPESRTAESATVTELLIIRMFEASDLASVLRL